MNHIIDLADEDSSTESSSSSSCSSTVFFFPICEDPRNCNAVPKSPPKMSRQHRTSNPYLEDMELDEDEFLKEADRATAEVEKRMLQQSERGSNENHDSVGQKSFLVTPTPMQRRKSVRIANQAQGSHDDAIVAVARREGFDKRSEQGSHVSSRTRSSGSGEDRVSI